MVYIIAKVPARPGTVSGLDGKTRYWAAGVDQQAAIRAVGAYFC